MNKNTKEAPYCVYRHLTKEGRVFYIGIGNNLRRPYNKEYRSKKWKEFVYNYPDYEVQVLTTGLTKEEADY
jgi:excinuclease UvrABC nuclease subunit